MVNEKLDKFVLIVLTSAIVLLVVSIFILVIAWVASGKTPC